jgi:hypothetical protein
MIPVSGGSPLLIKEKVKPLLFVRRVVNYLYIFRCYKGKEMFLTTSLSFHF